MTDPKWLKDPLPDWFFPIYDSIIQNKPIDQSPTIRQQPRILTWRFRTVHEILKWARMENARSGKALAVYDYANS